MKKYFTVVLLISTVVGAQVPKSKPVPNIKNGITLKTTGGVVMDKAYLEFNDGSPVSPPSNSTDVGKEIFLVLEIKTGWVPVKDNIQIGAKEKIVTATGEILLESDDLFKDMATISVEDAKYLRLKAVITNQTKPIPFFIVNFEVWDKQGPGKIKGSYKFKTTWKPS